MRKVLLSLFMLFFAWGANAQHAPMQVEDACISPDGLTLRLTLNYYSGPHLYIYISGITTTSGIQEVSQAANAQNPSYVDFTYDLSSYTSTPLTGCTAITYSSYGLAGNSGSTYTPLTICPCTEPTPTGCYYADDGGNVVVKLVSSQPNIDNYYLWDPNDLSGAHYVSTKTGVLDPDGVNYDYYFPNYPLTLKDGCATIYYSTQLGDGAGSYDPTEGTWAKTLTVCACPLAPVAQCYSDDGSGNLTIKLSYPLTIGMYLWTQGGSGTTFRYSPGTYIQQDNYGYYYEYTFNIPTSSIPGYTPNSTECFTFYIATRPTDPSDESDDDPQHFATPIRICPCCSQGNVNTHISYTMSTQSPNPLTIDFHSATAITDWNFGGVIQSSGINTSYTFPNAGTYPVTCTSSTPLSGRPPYSIPDCTKSDNICLTGISVDRSQNINSNVFSGPCSVDFTATINGNLISLTIPQTFTGGVISAYPATRYIIWGDLSPDISFSGALPSYTVTHPYTTTGNYVVYCSGVAGCLTGMSICIDDADHDEQRKANPNPPVPTVQQTVQSIDLFPNPATDVVTLTFNLQNPTTIKVDVVDVVGRVVIPVTNTPMNPGNQKIEINTTSLASGIYNVNIQTDKGTTTKRLSVVK